MRDIEIFLGDLRKINGEDNFIVLVALWGATREINRQYPETYQPDFIIPLDEYIQEHGKVYAEIGPMLSFNKHNEIEDKIGEVLHWAELNDIKITYRSSEELSRLN